MTIRKKAGIAAGIYFLFLISISFFTIRLMEYTEQRVRVKYEMEVTQLKGELEYAQAQTQLLHSLLEKYEDVFQFITEEDLIIIKTLSNKLLEKHSTLPSERVFPALFACMVAAKYHDVSFERAAALAWRESTFNYAAVSSANCKGLTQVSSLVWRVWGEKYGMDEFSVYNPLANAVVGIGYYKELKVSHKGNAERALSFYNGGSTGGESSRNYARLVLKTAESFKN